MVGMSFKVDCYSVPRADMQDYTWIERCLIEFDREAFGPVEDEQHVLIAHGEEGRLGGCTTSSRFGWLYIERLWVGSEHRGRGIGGELLDATEDLAKQMNLLGVRLITTDRHTGLALYLRKGFSVEYRLGGRLGDGSAIEEVGLSKMVI